MSSPFFAGLYGLNKKPVDPTPEPTSVVEASTEPATEPATEPEEPTQPQGSAYYPRIVTTTDVFEACYDAITAIDRLARFGYEGNAMFYIRSEIHQIDTSF